MRRTHPATDRPGEAPLAHLLTVLAAPAQLISGPDRQLLDNTSSAGVSSRLVLHARSDLGATPVVKSGVPLTEVPPVVDAGAVRWSRDTSACTLTTLDHVDAAERPTVDDYARYVAIARAYRERGYRDDALDSHPFVMVDPLFNALLARSEEALADIADVIGEPSVPHRTRAATVRDALLDRCYDPSAGHFFALDRHGGQVAEHCVAGLVPLVLDLSGAVVDALVGSMTSAPSGTRASGSTSTRSPGWAAACPTSAGRRP